MSPVLNETVAHLGHAMRHDFRVIWVGIVLLTAVQFLLLAFLITTRDRRK